ncbi:Phospholipase D1 [Gryganskiella cystojenkinii]|nr:Phospholipase D1 [Gryganskiella cystojenkinii]
MALDVPAWQNARPLDGPTKPKAIDISSATLDSEAEDDKSPISPAADKLLREAAERFRFGVKKKHTTPPGADNSISFTPPQTLSGLSPARATASGQSQSQPQQQPPQQPPRLSAEQQPSVPAVVSSDNPFDFEFKNPFSKRFHLGSGHRKSADVRRTSVVMPNNNHNNAASSSSAAAAANQLSSSSATGAASPEEDPARMMQLRQVFNKFFKRKKDGKKGRNADQVFEIEDYQLWNNLSPLVFQPSAVFMGLSFMIDDKGSALSDKKNVDWNMNIILALVKVVILPYTYTIKDTKIKNKDKDTTTNNNKSRLSSKEQEEKDAKEQKRFLIIKVQYGDFLPSWLIERTLDDFVRLYESYHPPIPEPPVLSRTLKVPKPPAMIRSRFGLGTSSSTNAASANLPNAENRDSIIDMDALPAFDPKAAPTLTRELQTFLQDMIRYAMHVPNAERMCKFLELSALTLANVPDGGYQGKEGYLTVVKQKSLMDEGPLTNMVKKVYRKPVPKYFIVRDSYIIVATSHKNTDIQDVILLDSSFKAQKSPRHLHVPHSFDLTNAELKFHVRAKSDTRRRQFVESIRKMPSLWKEPKRFNSFAPVRTNASAQWLVDGRDYFWNASKALEMAKETIYIEDWMLSPEILLRRHQKDGIDWSLKDILGRKAAEGVKIYIVMYSEVDAAMHLASLRAKKLLRALSPENIHVQRHGPNLKTAWWAHHEKLIVIDNMIAFIGGLDLCFGRWDTGEHTLIDCKESSGELGPRWPGQDYSNPRIKDFSDLSKPEVDSIDRAENPRMPWHDVGLQILGQPARDVARHFVQRWNFLCRTKPKQKKVPFLLPKPDIKLSKLEEWGLQGTCEVQILRSVSSWSIGVKDPECSILTAYIAAIERAEHFIYIENQFFITSTNVNKTIVHNGIGRALTDRIIKAHKLNQKFKVIVVLPLVPGFEGGINTPEATSVRMVMLSIYETICHGKNSIFGRLASAGVHKPHKYIAFYGLRNWAKFGEKFITEQVYIHAKMMIVDDRVAIIGSANINERSMLGNRDSEIAAVVRDQDYIDSTMNGIPYKVSRFAHTLRMSLMTEHLGLPTGHDHNGSEGKHARGDAAPFTELDFVDPIHPAFYEDIWKHHAEQNTLIFREMFKCIPDSTVKSWSQYNKFNAQSNVQDPRMNNEERTLKDKALDKILGPNLGDHFKSSGSGAGVAGDSSGEESDNDENSQHHLRGGIKASAASRAAQKALAKEESDDDEDPVRDQVKDQKIINQDPASDNTRRTKTSTEKTDRDLRTDEKVSAKDKADEIRGHQDQEFTSEKPNQEQQARGSTAAARRLLGVQRTASALAETSDVRIAMEEDLSKIQGHLVEWPLDFLREELESHNFCYPKDYNHPIDLYT